MSSLSELSDARLVRLKERYLQLPIISLAELTETPVSPAQDSLPANIGLELQVILTVDDPCFEPGEPDWEANDQTAVIADVHTHLISGRCLEEGVGYPWDLLMGDRRNGIKYMAPRVSVPCYEFSRPLSDRLTYEEWRELLSGTAPPNPPVWAMTFYDSSASLSNPSPEHVFHETRQVATFPFTIVPEIVDTGMVVTVPERSPGASAFSNWSGTGIR